MSNIIIAFNGVNVLSNGNFNILNKPESYLKAIFHLKQCCEDMLNNSELDIQSIGVTLKKDVFPSHGTKITVVSGHESIVPIVINAPSEEMITVASGQTVTALLTSILVDGGKGIAKVYTDSSKSTEATGTDPVTSIMVLESIAEDTATKITYILRKEPSDITIISIIDNTVVSAVNNAVGTESVTVISGKTVAELKAAILVDGGEGTAKVFTDSSKTTEATGTDPVSDTMVLESKAEDTITIVDYDCIV